MLNHRYAAVIFLGLIAGLTTLSAQVSGLLSGSVVDPSGAAVANATVKVYVTGGKEPVLTGRTNTAGRFAFNAVNPDTYDVGVEAGGFTAVTYRLAKVSPGQELALPPIKLELQGISQIVEVIANAQTVQSANAEVSTTITNTQIQNLPVLGRQVSTLFQTQPGVIVSGGPTVVNGLKASFSNVTLDGVSIQDNFSRTNDLDYAPFRTTIDQIAEITVTSSNASAAQGGGASQFILSTKSGANAYHGSVYWYNRNEALSANDWFNNRDGVGKTKLNLNQPGVALGGHIIRDKLFFYSNYEWFRNKEQSSNTRTVLTDSAKNGIFTYVDTNGAKQTANLQTLRGYTPDPTVKALIAQLPASNSPGGDGLNTLGYRFNAKANEFRDQFVGKMDYYLNAKNSITGVYNYIDNPTDRPDVTSSFYTVTPPVTNSLRNHLLSLSWRWTLSPTLTNEARGGFARTHGNFDDSQPYPKFLVGGLLFNNPVNTFLSQGRDTNTYPIQDNANWIKGNHQISFGYQFQRIFSAPFIDSGIVPTYTLGISTANTTGLTAADLPGIRSADLARANSLYANLAGIISSAAQTFNVTSATSGFVPGATNIRRFNNSTHALYAQDNWKLRPNLTVNLGVRYEYWTPVDEANGLFIAPRLENNDPKLTLLDPNAVLDFTGGSSGRKFYKSDKNNFAPNVGFAWDPFKTGKTSIRGGYMMAYVGDSLITTVRNNVNTNSGLTFPNTITNQVATLANAPTIPRPTYKVPRTLADNYAISRTSAAGLPDPNLVTPVVHQWNFSVEREVKGLLLSARYVGNEGHDLLRAIDYNQILYNANGFLADFQRAQSNAALAQAAGGSYNGTYNPNIAGSQPLTVFPQLGGNPAGLLTNATIQTLIRNGQIGELANTYMTNGLNGSVNFYTNPNLQGANTVTNGGSSSFHSLQLEATKRTRVGLQAQFSYVFGKSLANTSGDLQSNFEPLLDNGNPRLENARTPYDIRHSFKANYYYELPFGPGKRWGSSPILKHVIGGWAISGIMAYYSGNPFSVLSGYGTLNRDTRSAATNTASVTRTLGALEPLTSGVFKTGDNIYFVSPTIIGPDGRGASQPGTAAFTGQAFFNPVAGTVGNLQRRAFTGPWDWSWDASVVKSFRITERQTLDLHFDFFNVGNHPTFYMPPSTAGDYGSTTPYNINGTTFGQLNSMNHDPRQIQIGAYYRF